MEFDVLYFSGITLAILPKQVRDGLIEFLRDFRKQGRVAFDSNYRPRLWSSKEEAQKYISAAWSVTDIALPSLDDEMDLFSEKCEQNVMERLRENGVKYGALKRGELGPLGFGQTEKLQFDEASNVVDTTAAGDSFNGAFLAEFLQKEDEATAMQAGHKEASKVVTFRGAIIPKNA